ncbi:MAG: GNAT family N-acetyltransferase [Cyanobacteriota bacterium]
MGKQEIRIVSVHNKDLIEYFLRKNTDLNIYQIGDLDDFFWNSTIWLGLELDNNLEALVLIYLSPSIPVLLAFSEEKEKITLLLKEAINYLPNKFYAHLSPNLETIFFDNYKYDFNGEHLKMSLQNSLKLKEIDTSEVKLISSDELNELNLFYHESYPENWFDLRMLETKQYFGIKEQDKFISVAGIHVYSEKYKVSALGNITTHPNYRGKGLAKKVTAKLCNSLFDKGVKNIGLNVLASNEIAIKCYESLGFEKTAKYNEFLFEKIS